MDSDHVTRLRAGACEVGVGVVRDDGGVGVVRDNAAGVVRDNAAGGAEAAILRPSLGTARWRSASGAPSAMGVSGAVRARSGSRRWSVVMSSLFPSGR